MPYLPSEEEDATQFQAWQRINDTSILKALTRFGLIYSRASADEELRQHLSFYPYECAYNDEMRRICRLVDRLQQHYEYGQELSDAMLLHIFGDHDLAYICKDVNIIYQEFNDGFDCDCSRESDKLVTNIRDFLWGEWGSWGGA